METGFTQASSILLSPHMEQIAKQVAAKHGWDWRENEARLGIAMADRPERWLIINLDGERISLTRCVVEADGTLPPDVDMVFEIHDVGWEPIELLYSNEVFDAYAQAAQVAGIPIYMAQDNLRFDTFTEYWAKQLEDQGWLEHGYRLSEQETYGRIPGCQSTNHTQCYGELWQCAKCRKTVCYAEGTDNHPELCDDCWNQLYNSTLMPDKLAEDDVNGYTIFVPCDCNRYGGGCGTWLEITHDGILALEDKDRRRISISLPQWLDEAIRQAVLE